jgi:hypothetical protein
MLVLIEKVAPARDLVARTIGGVLVAWGATTLSPHSALGA